MQPVLTDGGFQGLVGWLVSCAFGTHCACVWCFETKKSLEDRVCSQSLRACLACLCTGCPASCDS